MTVCASVFLSGSLCLCLSLSLSLSLSLGLCLCLSLSLSLCLCLSLYASPNSLCMLHQYACLFLLRACAVSTPPPFPFLSLIRRLMSSSEASARIARLAPPRNFDFALQAYAAQQSISGMMFRKSGRDMSSVFAAYSLSSLREENPFSAAFKMELKAARSSGLGDQAKQLGTRSATPIACSAQCLPSLNASLRFDQWIPDKSLDLVWFVIREFKQKRLWQAEAAYELAAALDPSNPAPLSNLAHTRTLLAR